LGWRGLGALGRAVKLKERKQNSCVIKGGHLGIAIGVRNFLFVLYSLFFWLSPLLGSETSWAFGSRREVFGCTVGMDLEIADGSHFGYVLYINR
jgi:hypothetical protein